MESYSDQEYEFLLKFYAGESDLEKKFDMLLQALGGGQIAFYALAMPSENHFQAIYDSEIPIERKIQDLEDNLLKQEGLRKRILC